MVDPPPHELEATLRGLDLPGGSLATPQGNDTQPRVAALESMVFMTMPLRLEFPMRCAPVEVSLQSNAGCLSALAQVDDPTPGPCALDAIATRRQPLAARPVKAFNPLPRHDGWLFTTPMSGEQAVCGFANRDLRDKLAASVLRIHA